MWFKRLSSEPYLFPDQDDFKAQVTRGNELLAKENKAGLRDVVNRLLDTRVALTANDASTELASIAKS
jgi:hypothetical protein